MAQYVLGQVGMISKGKYASTTSYVALDVVSHRNGQFMCKAPCTGIEPGVTSNWGNYWVETAVGIYSMTFTAVSGSQTKVTVVYSNGTSSENTYTTSAIADNSVTTAKIVDLNVTNAKLANRTIVGGANGKIAEKTITGFNIADDTITYDKTDGIQKQHTKAQITLTANATSWQMTVQGVTATNTVIVSPADNDSYIQWRNCSIRATAQAQNSLTFAADTGPAYPVKANVLILD